jgi:hypothetical protein
MERKYTQKPWHITKHENLISIHTGETFEEINGIDPTICGIWTDNLDPDLATCEANALLIHTSPDLLEALEAILSEFELYALTAKDDELIDQARTAIKKATNQHTK